jgi:Ribosomal protein L11
MPNKTVKISVEGGNAKAAPPLAPTLSQLGLNVGEVVKKINEVTAQYKGLTVQVIIEIDSEKKTFEVKVGQPSTTSLLVKAVNAEAPSGDPEHKKIGNLGIEKIIEIAKMKKDSLTAKTLKKDGEKTY